MLSPQEWAGLGPAFLSVDTFLIEYPADADVAMKANLLGATFMINQLYFEGTQKKTSD